MEVDRAFDVVILVHVVEHLLHPLDVLTKAKERLKSGGQLILITPNPKSLGFRIFRRFWVPLGQPFHVRLYTLSTLRALTEQLGLRVESMQTNSTHSAPNIRDSIRAVVQRRPESLAGRLLRIRPLAKIVELGLLGLMLLGDSLAQTVGDECVLICER
jgi:SAM-dependent methyltransferase